MGQWESAWRSQSSWQQSRQILRITWNLPSWWRQLWSHARRTPYGSVTDTQHTQMVKTKSGLTNLPKWSSCQHAVPSSMPQSSTLGLWWKATSRRRLQLTLSEPLWPRSKSRRICFKHVRRLPHKSWITFWPQTNHTSSSCWRANTMWSRNPIVKEEQSWINEIE